MAAALTAQRCLKTTELFLVGVLASNPGTGPTMLCRKVPVVGAWRQLALGLCSAGPRVNNFLDSADSAALHQDKLKVISLKCWCQQRGARAMTGRRLGAPWLPHACCGPFPFLPSFSW